MSRNYPVQVQGDSLCKRNHKTGLPSQSRVGNEEMDYYFISLSIRTVNDNIYVKIMFLPYIVLHVDYFLKASTQKFV